MDNMEIWNALKQPPQTALRTIQGGRLKGKTDINPQWRYRAMTERFGACGVGWRYAIEKLWLEPAGDEICAFAEVGLAIKIDGEWSAFIPGVGGSMLMEQETKGLHVSDEAYKMAITDALSVAMKMLGVAADVYEGLFDGARYTGADKSAGQRIQGDVQPAKKAESPAPRGSQKAALPTPAEGEDWPSLKDLGQLYTRAKQYGISSQDVLASVEVGKGEDIIDLDEAWKATATKFASTIKAAVEATAGKE